MPFEKLYYSETSYTPLGGLGIRKGNFLKGVIEGKCTQTIAMVPPISHEHGSAGQPLEKGDPYLQGRGARVAPETERDRCTEGLQAILPRSRDQAS